MPNDKSKGRGNVDDRATSNLPLSSSNDIPPEATAAENSHGTEPHLSDAEGQEALNDARKYLEIAKSTGNQTDIEQLSGVVDMLTCPPRPEDFSIEDTGPLTPEEASEADRIADEFLREHGLKP